MVTTTYRESSGARPFPFIILFNLTAATDEVGTIISILPLEIGNVAWLTQDRKVISGWTWMVWWNTQDLSISPVTAPVPVDLS